MSALFEGMRSFGVLKLTPSVLEKTVLPLGDEDISVPDNEEDPAPPEDERVVALRQAIDSGVIQQQSMYETSESASYIPGKWKAFSFESIIPGWPKSASDPLKYAKSVPIPFAQIYYIDKEGTGYWLGDIPQDTMTRWAQQSDFGNSSTNGMNFPIRKPGISADVNVFRYYHSDVGPFTWFRVNVDANTSPSALRGTKVMIAFFYASSWSSVNEGISSDWKYKRSVVEFT